MKHLLSISLSLLIVLSSTGFTVATHFCGGKAVKTKAMLSHGQLDCGMAKMEKSCAASSEQTMKRKGCCENEYQSINLDDNYSPTDFQVALDAHFVLAFVHTFILNYPIANEHTLAFAYYSPPPLQQDVQVLFQTFLI